MAFGLAGSSLAKVSEICPHAAGIGPDYRVCGQPMDQMGRRKNTSVFTDLGDRKGGRIVLLVDMDFGMS